MTDDSDQFSKFQDNDDLKPIDFGTPGPEGPGDDVGALGRIPVPEAKVPEAKAPEAVAKQLKDGTAVPENVADYVYDESLNKIVKGDYIDLLKKTPSLRKMFVALGWDQVSMEAAQIDVDLSCFLLGRDGQTREDSDFLFYNNESAADNAVRHLGDNRIGTGDGDNEAVLFDLEMLHFDVARIVVVLTVYDENNDGLHLGQVKNLYLRMVNEEDENELFRYLIPEEATDHYNALTAISLVREGPRWIAEVEEKSAKGGLQELAQSYGIIIREATG